VCLRRHADRTPDRGRHSLLLRLLRGRVLRDRRPDESGDLVLLCWHLGEDKVAYWVTGPWFLAEIRKSGVKYQISAFPQIVSGIKSVPFLGAQGYMVTKYSTAHGVESLAKDLVANYMMQPAAQLTLALANDRSPANLKALAQVKDKDLKAFGAASSGGVPMPNIPQMASVWQDLGAAWVRSTKGAGSIPARKSFIGAQKSIAQKIG